MHRIGEEVSEALDRVPAVLRVLRTIRPKYACRSCEGPIVRKLHGSPTALCLGLPMATPGAQFYRASTGGTILGATPI
jgi:transposase